MAKSHFTYEFGAVESGFGLASRLEDGYTLAEAGASSQSHAWDQRILPAGGCFDQVRRFSRAQTGSVLGSNRGIKKWSRVSSAEDVHEILDDPGTKSTSTATEPNHKLRCAHIVLSIPIIV